MSSCLASQPSSLLSSLLTVLLEPGLEPPVRQQAGLQLKNLLQWPGVWQGLEAGQRQVARQGLLEALAREQWRPSVACLCVQAVARLEPWPGLLPSLAARLQGEVQDGEAMACLDTLACLLGEGEVEEAEAAEVLTAVVAVARGSSALAVRVAAYSCLEAMLPQVASNMARRGERDYLMQVQRTV